MAEPPHEAARYDEAEDTFPEGDPSSFQPGVPDESPQLARDGTQETFGTCPGGS